MKRTDNNRIALRALVLIPLMVMGAEAQSWDIGSRAATALSEDTGNKLKLTFEQRGRYEERSGTAFGKSPDIDTALFRTRLGLTYTPTHWLKFSGMVQDSRAPWYGSGAPNNVRDQADLHEGYIELFPAYKKGFGMTAGRMMLNYGEQRLIGTPQWGNVSRTYDHTRVYWRLPKVVFEALLVSPVKVRIGEFNKPVLGDRIWGTYNVVSNYYKKNNVEGYVLRREQNREGGFTLGSRLDGTDKLGITTVGFRASGPVAPGLTYGVEGAFQRGMVGPAALSSDAWAANLIRKWTFAKRTLEISGEYKYASGTDNPDDPKHTNTFDQLYGAYHDKYGHQDLFGWRNIRTGRFLATLGVTKRLAVNFMYDSYWLASAKDGLYNGSGKVIVRSATGTAGRHVGEEPDVYATYKYQHFTFGAGYGHFFSGQFIKNTTPGVGPGYVYIFHSYTL